MRILFLDDDLNRHATFKRGSIGNIVTFVETPDEAVEALFESTKSKDKRFNVVCLDHDLGGKVFQPSDENSGIAVCWHMNRMLFDHLPDKIILHSYNPEGVKNMAEALFEMQPEVDVDIAPFDTDVFWNLIKREQ
jgi:hypothetical protein